MLTEDDIGRHFGSLQSFLDVIVNVIRPQVSTALGLYQLIAIVFTGLVSWLICRLLIDRLSSPASLGERFKWWAPLAKAARAIALPAIWGFGVAAASALFTAVEAPSDLLRIASSLLFAWIMIRLVTANVKDTATAGAIGVIVWLVAALSALRLLEPTIAFLDSFAFTLGKTRISLFILIKSLVVGVVLFRIATFLAGLIQSRLAGSQRLPPAVRTLASQAVKMMFVIIAVVIALTVIGIDLTALAVFSGAVGVGVGLGLQAVFSNFISGVIILIERSLKVGDFVELDNGLTGVVREVNMRTTVITPNDNLDILVPNSDFINGRVTNWTHRDAFRRVRIPFGVAYGTDKELVRTAVLAAAEGVSHTLDKSHGRDIDVWLVGFGDNALDFELVVWLNPASVARPWKVKADFYWAIHTALVENDIAIPFPQRDLHIIQPAELSVRVRSEPSGN